MRMRTVPLAAVAGIAATGLAATALRMPAREALQLAGIAVGAAVAAGILGALALRFLRRSSIGAQTTVAAAAAVAAVGAGAWAAAAAMFLSIHDLHALVVVLVAAVSTGVVLALVLGRHVGVSSRALGEAARRIGAGELDGAVASPSTKEFGELARELSEMQAKLADARERERTADAVRRELVAWVSHDLRTPLAGIRAMGEALEDGIVDDPETVSRYHRTIRIETERLARLVDDLFELSRIHAGALRLQMERVSLGDLVSDALAAEDPLARSKGVRLEGGVAGPSPELHVSPPEFQRVLRNLIANAIRHTPSDGTVSVEAGRTGDAAYVSVADACGGIPEDTLARVFDVAFRGERARTPTTDGGAGLGLAIARGLVEAHHGDIDVANVGAGCRFTVRIPLDRDHVPR